MNGVVPTITYEPEITPVVPGIFLADSHPRLTTPPRSGVRRFDPTEPCLLLRLEPKGEIPQVSEPRPGERLRE